MPPKKDKDKRKTDKGKKTSSSRSEESFSETRRRRRGSDSSLEYSAVSDDEADFGVSRNDKKIIKNLIEEINKDITKNKIDVYELTIIDIDKGHNKDEKFPLITLTKEYLNEKIINVLKKLRKTDNKIDINNDNAKLIIESVILGVFNEQLRNHKKDEEINLPAHYQHVANNTTDNILKIIKDREEKDSKKFKSSEKKVKKAPPKPKPNQSMRPKKPERPKKPSKPSRQLNESEFEKFIDEDIPIKLLVGSFIAKQGGLKTDERYEEEKEKLFDIYKKLENPFATETKAKFYHIMLSINKLQDNINNGMDVKDASQIFYYDCPIDFNNENKKNKKIINKISPLLNEICYKDLYENKIKDVKKDFLKETSEQRNFIYGCRKKLTNLEDDLSLDDLSTTDNLISKPYMTEREKGYLIEKLQLDSKKEKTTKRKNKKSSNDKTMSKDELLKFIKKRKDPANVVLKPRIKYITPG